MNKIVKTYDEFVNEEVNLKKAIAGAAIGAGLAFGSPNVEAKPVKAETTQTTSQYGVDFSQVVQLDSTLKKNDIYMKLLSGLRSINGCRVLQSTPDKISCSIRMSSKPDGSNGQTNANLNVYIKDGKFKVEFTDINFIYIGQQPTTRGEDISRNLSNIGRTIGIQTVSGMIPDRTLGNVVGQSLNQATRPMPGNQKTTFTFTEAKQNRKMSGYVSSVESEMSQIVNHLKSNFMQGSSDNW
jgi:hypothetical protein